MGNIKTSPLWYFYNPHIELNLICEEQETIYSCLVQLLSAINWIKHVEYFRPIPRAILGQKSLGDDCHFFNAILYWPVSLQDNDCLKVSENHLNVKK